MMARNVSLVEPKFVKRAILASFATAVFTMIATLPHGVAQTGFSMLVIEKGMLVFFTSLLIMGLVLYYPVLMVGVFLLFAGNAFSGYVVEREASLVDALVFTAIGLWLAGVSFYISRLATQTGRPEEL